MNKTLNDSGYMNRILTDDGYINRTLTDITSIRAFILRHYPEVVGVDFEKIEGLGVMGIYITTKRLWWRELINSITLGWINSDLIVRINDDLIYNIKFDHYFNFKVIVK